MALGASAEEGEEERSLRDDLARGLAEIEAREAAAAPEDEGAQAPEAQSDAEASETEADRGDGRDAHGRFVSSKQKEEAPEAPADTSQSQAPEDKPSDPAPTEAPETGADQPPKSWRADEAAAWKDLPAPAKAAILRREAEAARLAGSQDNERLFGREIAEVFRPHMEVINSFGVSPQIALKGLLENDKILRFGTPEQKIAKARQLVSDYGLDISQLADTSHLPSDPHVAAMQAKIAELEQRLAQPQGGPQQQQFAPLPPSQEDNTIIAEIEAFRVDPAHPHFDAVHQQMGRLLETGAAPDLETAYHAAVAMNPALRSTATAPQRTQQEDKIAAARRAAASVTGSPGATGSPRPMSLRDELAEGLRSAGFPV